MNFDGHLEYEKIMRTFSSNDKKNHKKRFNIYIEFI
jgi:hypothetical protein